jgi:hypothetical protein
MTHQHDWDPSTGKTYDCRCSVEPLDKVSITTEYEFRMLPGGLVRAQYSGGEVVLNLLEGHCSTNIPFDLWDAACVFYNRFLDAQPKPKPKSEQVKHTRKLELDGGYESKLICPSQIWPRCGVRAEFR